MSMEEEEGTVSPLLEENVDHENWEMNEHPSSGGGGGGSSVTFTLVFTALILVCGFYIYGNAVSFHLSSSDFISGLSNSGFSKLIIF